MRWPHGTHLMIADNVLKEFPEIDKHGEGNNGFI